MAATIIATLRASAGQFHSEMAKADAEMKKLGTEGSGHMKKLQEVGKLAFLGIGAAAATGAVVAIKAAGDYQESLTQLVTGAGESQKNIKLVGDGMLHMAGQVGISADELSKGMYLIESAGYHGANGLLVLKAAAEGARVGGADMATVADGLTTALTDYHLPASQAADVTSKLVETVASGKTHMADLAGALATVLPAASAAHVGLAQVLGAMATMTASGTPAADAATYLKQTIAQLSNPTAKAASEMKGLGLSAIDVSSHLGSRGLTGTMTLLTDAIEKRMGPAGTVLVENMKKSAGSTTAFQKILANLPPTQQTFIGALATMVGGTKSMQAALELTGTNAATFNTNVQNISATTTEAGGHVKGFADTQKDLNTKIDNVKAAFHTLVIEIGDKLIPIVSSAITWVQKHKALMEVLAGVVGGLLVVAIAAYVVSMVSAAVATVAATWPILAIIAAVALLAVGAYELYKHWNTVWNFIKEITGHAVAFIIDIIKGIADAFMAVVGVIIHGAASAFGWVPGVGGKLKAAARAFDGFRNDVNTALTNVANDALTWGETAGNNFANGFKAPAMAAFNAVRAATPGNIGAALNAYGATQKLMQQRAAGGPTSANTPYLIGEQGPEIFVPSTAGVVLPNSSLRGTGAGSALGGPSVVQIVLDGKVIAEAVTKHQRKQYARGVPVGAG